MTDPRLNSRHATAWAIALASPLLLPLALTILSATSALGQNASGDPWVSPSSLAVSSEGGTLFIASETSKEVLCFDTNQRRVTRTLPVPAAPSGLVLSPDGSQLFVTCASAESTLEIIDWRTAKTLRSVKLGSAALSPVLSPDGTTAYVCNRFNDAVSVVNLAQGIESHRIPVQREPVAAALTPDGTTLFVANHLPVGRADAGIVSAHITVIDTRTARAVASLALPNGGNLIRDVRVSPDGRLAAVTHTVARFQLPTTQVERGWMNANALTLLDVPGRRILNTVLLDQVERGSANPWAAAWSTDGQTLVITHAGTHELSILNVPALLAKLQRTAETPPGRRGPLGYVVSQTSDDVPTDLSFLADVRHLVSLGGNGPRAVALHGRFAFVGNYFSEDLSIVDLGSRPLRAEVVPLHARRPMDVVRRGEVLFNDATLCLENWQSCASCHSSDARVDALNWDLMNDGKSNAKNTKSLLRSELTAPAMSLGVRANAKVAVRAGIHHILFTEQPEEVPAAIDQWLASVAPVPSPHLVQGKLSPAAERGRSLFFDATTGCSGCHPPPLYTDRQSYEVGTRSATDRTQAPFDTPTLLEIWRTAPYLHDGSAESLREVLLQRNARDEHGKTSHLKPVDIDDLVAFLLSL